MAGPSTSYLPQRPFFLEHSHHHAHGNHQAGEDSHKDAQDLGPGGEAVVAILRGLVLDNVVHQQSLWDGKKVKSSQRSHAQKKPGDDGHLPAEGWSSGREMPAEQLITLGGHPGILAAPWFSSTIQQLKLSSYHHCCRGQDHPAGSEVGPWFESQHHVDISAEPLHACRRERDSEALIPLPEPRACYQPALH